MPRASKRKISRGLKQELENNFSDLISTLQAPSEINEFLNTFLTQEEKIMVSKRLMLYVMFEKGYKTVNIAEFLSMSRVTVIRHRDKWFSNNRSFMVMLNKLKKRRSVKNFWNTLEEMLYPLDVVLKSRTNMRARAKLYSGDFKKDKY